MATIRQKELAKEIIANSRAKQKKNKKELLVSAGYSIITAEAAPNLIISQKGVQKELKNLGFTEEGAKNVVEEILYDKSVEPSDRLKASDMIFKVHGTYAPEKRINASVDINELQRQITAQIQQFRQGSLIQTLPDDQKHTAIERNEQ